MSRFLLFVPLTLVLAFGLVGDARAGLITPSGLKPGDQFRIVFVTTTVTQATSSSLPYYDAIVRGDAVAGGLGSYQGSPVTWEVIGSTDSVDAITRLPADSVPIFLPDGSEVASSGTTFWGGSTVQLLHPINETATGAPVNSFSLGTWTGSRANGTLASTPSAKGLGDATVAAGYPGAVDNTWVHSSDSPPSFALSLYGFSSVLTVPGVTQSIPEPSSVVLVLVGIGGFFGARLARRRTSV